MSYSVTYDIENGKFLVSTPTGKSHDGFISDPVYSVTEYGDRIVSCWDISEVEAKKKIYMSLVSWANREIASLQDVQREADEYLSTADYL